MGQVAQFETLFWHQFQCAADMLAGACLCFLLLCACAPRLAGDVPVMPGELVKIEAGPFMMGSYYGRHANQPPHLVILDAFEIDRYEVTEGQFRVYIAATGQVPLVWLSQPVTGDDRLPMVGVIWREVSAYCQWRGMRLPTGAEWEKAARGQDGRNYPWGNQWRPDVANTEETAAGGLRPVGSYPAGASPYGLLDMAGNAAEWVADHFDPGYYAVSPQFNPTGPAEALDHVLRGGSWAAPAEQATVFQRNASHSVRPNLRVGFRCARSLPEG